MSRNEYMRQYMNERYKKRRAEAIVTLGSKCSECGAMNKLDIHHIDPSTKSFTLARGSSFSQKRWDEELRKCTLLCKTCHGAEHRSKAECGTVQRYWAGCRCEPCTTANSVYNREYRRNRSTLQETDSVNALKFGEPCDVAIPS